MLSVCLMPVLRSVSQMDDEDDAALLRDRGSDHGGSAALAACGALLSLAFLKEAKLAIVKQHPQVRLGLGIVPLPEHLDECPPPHCDACSVLAIFGSSCKGLLYATPEQHGRLKPCKDYAVAHTQKRRQRSPAAVTCCLAPDQRIDGLCCVHPQAVSRLATLSQDSRDELRVAALTVLASLSEEAACCEALAGPLLDSAADESARCLEGSMCSLFDCSEKSADRLAIR